MNDPIIKVLVLPGGQLPVRGRLHDAGCDAFIRAIVTREDDKDVTGMKHTIWNFQGPPPAWMAKDTVCEHGVWKYILRHNMEPVFFGLGVIFGGQTTDWVVQTSRRSSAAFRRLRLHDYLEEVLIDPNFRGESMMYLANDNPAKPLEITRGSSFTQFKFDCSGRGFARPILEEVKTYVELGYTGERGLKCNDSSGPKFFQTEMPIL